MPESPLEAGISRLVPAKGSGQNAGFRVPDPLGTLVFRAFAWHYRVSSRP